MGQVLSVPLLLAGMGLMWTAYRTRTASGNYVQAQ
jgi:prolipoprotein diacylglyceryltransferase